ncbi:hydrolase [Virgibacillus sp. 179-BFC.A HS]|uniref:Hydrolase n=1 Tax=Tigheibacillus jepli TaxID=3035914 RepID=A0ABU5CG29_9BACI|nr:hydrolase [Virgibacillus sp. 179-BFC.A HS]MDY0405273.1 hydrolase [Virgibacillus sp. 179-BFC.A HS]
MEKEKYYVNLGTKEISKTKYHNNDTYVIYATPVEVEQLRSKFDHMDDAEYRTFLRAHVPIMPYHHDEGNDDYDRGITNAFQMLYELGDEQTKEHITNIGILRDNHL